MNDIQRRDIGIKVEPDVPEEARAAVLPLIRRWARWWPQWCHTFYVAYDGDSSGEMAISYNYRTRWVKIHVTGLWMGLDDCEREAALVHELAHALLSPFATAMDNLTETLDVPKIGKKALDEAFEATTEDIAQAILANRGVEI